MSRATDARAEDGVRFDGYERPDGVIGVRRKILVLPSVICSRIVADRIAAAVPEAVSTPHDHGCAQLGADNEQTKRTFVGIATNPNVDGTVVVGLGCEEIQSDEVAAELRDRDAPVAELSIQGVGGTEQTVDDGTEAARRLRTAAGSSRHPADLSNLTVGIVGSDATDSTVDRADPLIGAVARRVVDAGGRVLVAGIERFTAHPDAATATTAAGAESGMDALLERYQNFPARATRVYADAAATPFESLSRQWGSLPVRGVVEYGGRAAHDEGVALIDSPSQFEEAATALAAAGAHVVIHATADGIPTGHPIVPVIKVSGDEATVAALPDDVDIDATAATEADLLERLVAVADGRPARAERHGITEFAITRVGPSM